MAFNFPDRSKRSPQRLEMFEQLAARIPNHDAQLGAAVKSLVGAYKEVTEQQVRLSRDEASTPGARLVKIAKSARTKIVPLMEGLDAILGTVGERKAHLRAEIEKVYNPPDKKYETVIRHQEIRAHFRQMPRTQALQALEVARLAGDEDTLIALASYQPYLSGLPPEMHKHTRDHLVEAKAPDQAAALQSLQEQEELVRAFRGEMAQSVADLIDFHKADEIIAAARDDAAA
jgi:hypothetical protein